MTSRLVIGLVFVAMFVVGHYAGSYFGRKQFLKFHTDISKGALVSAFEKIAGGTSKSLKEATDELERSRPTKKVSIKKKKKTRKSQKANEVIRSAASVKSASKLSGKALGKIKVSKLKENLKKKEAASGAKRSRRKAPIANYLTELKSVSWGKNLSYLIRQGVKNKRGGNYKKVKRQLVAMDEKGYDILNEGYNALSNPKYSKERAEILTLMSSFFDFAEQTREMSYEFLKKNYNDQGTKKKVFKVLLQTDPSGEDVIDNAVLLLMDGSNKSLSSQYKKIFIRKFPHLSGQLNQRLLE